MNSDYCGMLYMEEEILPSHHFRSSALYKSKIHEKVNYMPTKLSKHGFREEQLFSFKLLCNGFKIGVNTKAVAWHLNTPSGGERFPDSQQLIKFNEEILKEETKELFNKYGNFIEEYNKKLKLKLNEPKEELLKQTNLIIK
jgi:hypothetical protein